MSKKAPTRISRKLHEEAAAALFQCALARSPIEGAPFWTVKACLDVADIESIQTKGIRVLSWIADEDNTLSKALDSCRACIRLEDDEGISDAAILSYIKEEAVGIGERYFGHRDLEQATIDSLAKVHSIISTARENRSEWTFWFPIVRLVLPSLDSSFFIGPVKFQRDLLGNFMFSGEEDCGLGDYGKWAVASYGLGEEEKRKRWAGSFQEVFSAAKVAGIFGDEPHAYRMAREEIARAFAVLRVSHRNYGSWTGENDFVVPGEPLFASVSFDLKGSEKGGVTHVLASKQEPSQPESAVKSSYILRTDIFSSVRLDDYVWTQRQAAVQKMASLMWSNNNWPEIVSAIRVFDESIRIGFAGAAFLGLMNAIEVLMGGDFKDWNDSIRNRLAERVGILLGESDPTFRMDIAKSFKELYSRRSALTHSASSVSLKELSRLEFIARILIMRMTWEVELRNFQGFKDFAIWIHNIKFGHQYEAVEVPDWLRLSSSWLD